MRVEFLGQATTLTDLGPVRLLSDPWLSGRAHQGGWVPFPDWTAAEREALVRRADTATHVYVSHDHADHFDPDLLARLGPKTIISADFANQSYRDRLAAVAAQAGHTVRLVGHGEPVELAAGVTAQIFAEQPGFRTNSILLLRGPHGSLLNGNDCGLDTLLLAGIARQCRPTLFLYTLNFLANGYPYPYLRRTSPDLQERVRAVRDEVVGAFRTALGILRPTFSLAFAGPVTFADAVNAYLDDMPEARDWSAMVAELSAGGHAVAWPAPGSVVHCRDGKVTSVQLRAWQGLGQSHRASYVPPPDRFTAPDQPGPDEVGDAAARFGAELTGLRAALAEARRSTTALVLTAVDGIEQLESGPARYHVVLAPAGAAADKVSVSVVEAGAALPQPRLELIAPPTALVGLCDGSLDYDGFLLSGRARFARVPDSFDSVLHNLLRFGRDPLQRAALAQWWSRSEHETGAPETLVKLDGDRRVLVPRRCPHEGEPFDLVEICAGRLTCPRHRWVYDVTSGACLRGDTSVNLYARGPGGHADADAGAGGDPDPDPDPDADADADVASFPDADASRHPDGRMDQDQSAQR